MSQTCVASKESPLQHEVLVHSLDLWVVVCVLLMAPGCVSQRDYERVKAEAEELSSSFIAAREEVAILSQSVVSLEKANKEEENRIEELRGVIQREVELLPLMRQQAYERMVSLQAQIAELADQGRTLAKQLAAARRESNSLKVLVSHYRQEVEAARALESSLPEVATPAALDSPIRPQQDPSLLESIPPPMTMSQEVAQQKPVPPTESSVSVPPSLPPAREAGQSWIDLIVKWLVSLWDWILGLFG